MDDNNTPFFLQYFATLSDWPGQAANLWSGRHVMKFILLLCLLPFWIGWTKDAIGYFKNPGKFLPPFLNDLSMARSHAIRSSHAACSESLCDLAKTYPLSCTVKDERLAETNPEIPEDPGSINVPIALPDTCQTAFKVTADLEIDTPLLLGKADMVNTILRSALNNKQKQGDEKKALLYLLMNCTAVISPEILTGTKSRPATVDYIFRHSLLEPVPDYENLKPGTKIDNILQYTFCPDKMDPRLHGKLSLLYKQALDFRILWAILMVGGITSFARIGALFGNVLLVFYLGVMTILPAFPARRFLRWPEATSFLTVWKGMLLIAFLVDGSVRSPALPCIMAVIALVRYRNKRACLEWLVLAVSSLGYSKAVWELPDATSETQKMAVQYFSLTVPGKGTWMKLVTLYVFVQSYRGLPKDAGGGENMSSNPTARTRRSKYSVIHEKED